MRFTLFVVTTLARLSSKPQSNHSPSIAIAITVIHRHSSEDRVQGLDRDDAVAAHHHHPDVLLELCVDGAVQHEVHELVKPPQGAGDVAVGVEGDLFWLCCFVVEAGVGEG